MIEINNLTAVSIREDFLKKICQNVLKGEKKEGKELSIALIGQGRMRKINKKYRGKNQTTDVLAFSEMRAFMEQKRSMKTKTKFLSPSKVLLEKFKVGPVQKNQKASPKKGEGEEEMESLRYLGEIIICPREINKNAKKYKFVGEEDKSSSSRLASLRSARVFKKELARVLIHGILHLLGYDHEKNEVEAEKMRKKEKDYLLVFYVKN